MVKFSDKHLHCCDMVINAWYHYVSNDWFHLNIFYIDLMYVYIERDIYI